MNVYHSLESNVDCPLPGSDLRHLGELPERLLVKNISGVAFFYAKFPCLVNGSAIRKQLSCCDENTARAIGVRTAISVEQDDKLYLYK